MPLPYPHQVTLCDCYAVLIERIEGELVATSEAAVPKDRMCRASTDTREPVNLLTRRGGRPAGNSCMVILACVHPASFSG